MVGFNFFFNSVYTNPAMDHLVLMVAIQCFAKGPKGDLYLLEVYPPNYCKDFSYHLLTKYHRQYLNERVFNNFAVKLRKS